MKNFRINYCCTNIEAIKISYVEMSCVHTCMIVFNAKKNSILKKAL